MFEVGIDIFFAAAIGIAVVAYLVAGFFYHRRDRLTKDPRRITTIFCCVKCGKIYEKSRSREVGVCPKCGFKNNRLRF